MTITDAQVEAAAKAIYENAPGFKAPETPRRTWEEMPHRYRKSWLRMAQQGLEAAERAAWRPIEEAPRDGTVIDVWLGNANESDVEFYCTPGTRRSPGWAWGHDRFRPCAGLLVTTFVVPTHWRLPPNGPGNGP